MKQQISVYRYLIIAVVCSSIMGDAMITINLKEGLTITMMTAEITVDERSEVNDHSEGLV